MDEKIKALTVGQLRGLISKLPDSVEVVIDTDGWYDNIQGVIVPSIEEAHADYVCLTLIPSAMTNPDTRYGNWDARQTICTIPSDEQYPESVEKPYGVFITDNMDEDRTLAIYEDGSPVVFATEDEAHEWAHDNYPSYFSNNPNGWQHCAFEIGRV